MPPMTKIFKMAFQPNTITLKVLKKISHCRHIWSPSDTIAGILYAAYMVPKVIDIECIFGPYLDRYCKHNWSPL